MKRMWRKVFAGAIGAIFFLATSLGFAQDVALEIVSSAGEAYIDIDPRDEDTWWLFLEAENTTAGAVTLNAVTLDFSYDNRYLSVNEVTTDNTELANFTLSYNLKVKGDLATVKASLASATGYALGPGAEANCLWLKLNPHKMDIDVRYDLMVKGKIYDGVVDTTYKREDTAQVYCDTAKGDNSCAGPLANSVTGYDVLMASRQVVGLEDYLGDSVLLKDIMDTNGDGEIDADDVYHTAKKAADLGYTMPADASGAHPAPAKKGKEAENFFASSFRLTELERLSPYDFRVYLEVKDLPSEPIGVDVEFIFAPNLEVKINLLDMLKASNKAFAIQQGRAHLVFSEPEAYKTREGRLAEVQLRVAQPNALPEFGMAWVLLNEGRIPVKWETKRVAPRTALLQNYPNPFNPETWIPFQLGKTQEIVVSIYNLLGQLVRSLDLGHKNPGFYIEKSRAAHWDGKNNAGERVASGLYFYQLGASTKKMLMLK